MTPVIQHRVTSRCCKRYDLDVRTILEQAARQTQVRMYDIQEAVDRPRPGRAQARRRRAFFAQVLDGVIRKTKEGDPRWR